MAIIQSLAQLERNYDKLGAEIIVDNCQLSIFGGFAPNSETAETFSKNLGTQTILSGTVSKGKGESSQSLQMIERPLMTSDELKSMPKGNFIVMKTGSNPIKTELMLYEKWGIRFEDAYRVIPNAKGVIEYVSKEEITNAIIGYNPLSIVPKKGTLKIE